MTSTIEIPTPNKTPLPTQDRIAGALADHLNLSDTAVRHKRTPTAIIITISGTTPAEVDDATHLYLGCAGITYTTHHETPTALAGTSLPRWARRRVFLSRREVRTHGL